MELIVFRWYSRLARRLFLIQDHHLILKRSVSQPSDRQLGGYPSVKHSSFSRIPYLILFSRH